MLFNYKRVYGDKRQLTTKQLC